MTAERIHEIRVGDYVRSYDFPDDEDCYIEGVVLETDRFFMEKGVDCYVIKVKCVVWQGKRLPRWEWRSNIITPPMNGSLSSFGRVMNSVICLNSSKCYYGLIDGLVVDLGRHREFSTAAETDDGLRSTWIFDEADLRAARDSINALLES